MLVHVVVHLCRYRFVLIFQNNNAFIRFVNITKKRLLRILVHLNCRLMMWSPFQKKLGSVCITRVYSLRASYTYNVPSVIGARYCHFKISIFHVCAGAPCSPGGQQWHPQPSSWFPFSFRPSQHLMPTCVERRP